MFERKVEHNQEEAFADSEAVRQYAECAEKSSMRYRAFLKNINALGITGRYLEIGAGPGILTYKIARDNPGTEITALEPSADMVSFAMNYVTEKGLHDQIQFIEEDASDKGLVEKLGMFDLIYTTYALHHWDDPKEVIANLYDMLKPGGVLLIHDLRRAWWLYWVPIHNGFFYSIRAAYRANEIRDMLTSMGIEKYEVKNEFPFLLSTIVRK